jgi:hypothetical protein
MLTGSEKSVPEFAADWFASVDDEGLRAKTAHDYKKVIERWSPPWRARRCSIPRHHRPAGQVGSVADL